MIRVTVMVPQALMRAANHVHLLMGKSTALNTYTIADFEDGVGNLYAVSSGIWGPLQLAGVQNPSIIQIQSDADLVPDLCDTSQVAIAQAAFVLDDEEVTANPAKIVAVTGDDPHAILAAHDLTRLETEA